MIKDFSRGLSFSFINDNVEFLHYSPELNTAIFIDPPHDTEEEAELIKFDLSSFKIVERIHLSSEVLKSICPIYMAKISPNQEKIAFQTQSPLSCGPHGPVSIKVLKVMSLSSFSVSQELTTARVEGSCYQSLYPNFAALEWIDNDNIIIEHIPYAPLEAVENKSENRDSTKEVANPRCQRSINCSKFDPRTSLEHIFKKVSVSTVETTEVLKAFLPLNTVIVNRLQFDIGLKQLIWNNEWVISKQWQLTYLPFGVDKSFLALQAAGSDRKIYCSGRHTCIFSESGKQIAFSHPYSRKCTVTLVNSISAPHSFSLPKGGCYPIAFVDR